MQNFNYHKIYAVIDEEIIIENGKIASVEDVGMDIFSRGLCLPSDNKMTPEQQDVIIEVVKKCFE